MSRQTTMTNRRRSKKKFMSSIYKCIIVYKRAVDSKSTAYFPASPKLLTSGRTDGQTDRQTDRQTRYLKGDHSQKIMQRAEVQSQRKKKHAVPIACQKIRQNRSEILIAVPGSTVTYSRLNRKYNICAFTQEIQVFEG